MTNRPKKVVKTLRPVLQKILLPNCGRCYDHNFLRFLTIFGEKIGVFSQTPMLWSEFCII
jgi:hypothetical protein